MGVVDEDGSTGAGGAGKIEAPRAPCRFSSSGNSLCGARSGGHAQARRDKRVRGLEGADQRQAEGFRSAFMLDREALAKAVTLGRDEPQELSPARPTDITESPRDLASAATCSPALLSTSITAPAPCGSSSANRRSFTLK